MPAQMRIDQAGLPLGTPGIARTDGLDTGALVTVTNVGGGSSTKVRLLWVPPEDLTAIPSLVAAGPTSWTFSPQAGCWGSYRIELIVDEGLPTESRQVRIFGVRLPSSGLLIPAANETADPSASRLNAGANVIARSENNEPFAPFGTGSAFGWWKALRDLVLQADASSTGIRYRLVSGVNVTVQPNYQYLVKAPLIIDPGASLVALPGGQIVVLP
jgi:hypothetical protein